ncbi:hypothetical protein BC628DRAFT_1340735 [Trametes gibbosa]|nr:hypothetical protein BC628DRAFT_1340735 [Trametes gibbosa]
MFTTLITLFLSIFGALRAFPLYSGILTLGNGFTGRGSWFNCASVLPLLDSEAAIITGELFGNGTPARIFHWPLPLPLPLSLPAPPVILSLPSPPVLLTLSAGTLGRPDAYHDLISVLTLAALVGLTILVPIKAILSLRAWVRAAPSVDTIDHVAAVIYVSGSPYEGDVFSAWNDLVGALDASISSAMSSIYTPTAAPSSYVPTPCIPSGKKAKRTRTISRAPPLQPVVIARPAPAAPPWNMAIATEVEPSSRRMADLDHAAASTTAETPTAPSELLELLIVPVVLCLFNFVDLGLSLLLRVVGIHCADDGPILLSLLLQGVLILILGNNYFSIDPITNTFLVLRLYMLLTKRSTICSWYSRCSQRKSEWGIGG